MLKKIVLVLLVGCLAWAYQATRPPPPKICGSPGGLPITSSRIKLRDGRQLAYAEHGVPKDMAKYKIIFAHGFGSSRHDASIATSETTEQLGIYLLTFDRPGYGESDPDPKRTMQSTALDIEELADKMGLGQKFYVIGYSMGGQVVWGCLKYIPHRLEGAALIAPVVNYWWSGFPKNLSAKAYYEQYPQDQWALRVAHYIPWLTYWWNTQKWFPASSAIARKPKFSHQDLEIMSKFAGRQSSKHVKSNEMHVNSGFVTCCQKQTLPTQQGEFESIHRDMMVGFGSWEFDVMEIKNPFANTAGTVYLWQGDHDGLVPVTLQRHIVGRLPWIQYNEIAGGGHLFPYADGIREAIMKALLRGEKLSTVDS
ncbi:hypothetical protein RJ639_025326 [Escallonia herrerae]|uniref:AB hydrolase-1 domain-containing protein n=1 Tax=Escallonia herrerae TaxID=1293975 RepID=A0AA88UXJ8_9ASTE|nr:hypothetical protein RJ639_025326 [Escallonia herrerae]